MSDPYLVSPLTSERIPAAFALVSVLETGVTEDAWRTYAEALVGSAGNGVGLGIVTVQGGHRRVFRLERLRQRRRRPGCRDHRRALRHQQ